MLKLHQKVTPKNKIQLYLSGYTPRYHNDPQNCESYCKLGCPPITQKMFQYFGEQGTIVEEFPLSECYKVKFADGRIYYYSEDALILEE